MDETVHQNTFDRSGENRMKRSNILILIITALFMALCYFTIKETDSVIKYNPNDPYKAMRLRL
jgi:hypothetical protein